MAGRPLRFLGAVAGGWVAVRVFLLWPGAVVITELGHAILPSAIADGFAAPAAPAARPAGFSPGRSAAAVAGVAAQPSDRPIAARTATVALAAEEPPQAAPPPPPPLPPPPGIVAGLPPADPPGAPGHPTPARLSGSAWLFARGGRGLSAGLVGSQLGGSQAGVRLAYALGDARRVALAARISAPLHGAGRELALGVEWRPTRLPVRIVAEHRLSLDGARGGPALGVVGGAGPMPVAAGFSAEGYGQAGVVARGGAQGFADGAIRLARPLAAIGGVRFDLGGGAWGAAQTGAARLDLGPSLAASLPVAGRRIRVALDWRERVAGDARPSSGIVLSVGGDF